MLTEPAQSHPPTNSFPIALKKIGNSSYGNLHNENQQAGTGSHWWLLFKLKERLFWGISIDFWNTSREKEWKTELSHWTSVKAPHYLIYMDEKIIKLGFAEISLLGITGFHTKKMHVLVNVFPTVSISKYFLLWLFGCLIHWELLLVWKLNGLLSGLLEACKVKFWTLWPITTKCGRGSYREPGHKLSFHRKPDKRFMPTEIKAK